jgi:hypothetical protein
MSRKVATLRQPRAPAHGTFYSFKLAKKDGDPVESALWTQKVLLFKKFHPFFSFPLFASRRIKKIYLTSFNEPDKYRKVSILQSFNEETI